MWRAGPRGRALAVIPTKRGIWTLPKGRLRAGEDFEDAALREVEE